MSTNLLDFLRYKRRVIAPGHLATLPFWDEVTKVLRSFPKSWPCKREARWRQLVDGPTIYRVANPPQTTGHDH